MKKYPSEHMEQVRLFAWIKKKAVKCPEMSLIFAIPNGGLRDKITAAKMKAEGVNKGIPDIFVPIPAVIKNKQYHGAFIEMKSQNPKTKTTKEQQLKLKQLNSMNYACTVCHGADEAKKFIENYLINYPHSLP